MFFPIIIKTKCSIGPSYGSLLSLYLSSKKNLKKISEVWSQEIKLEAKSTVSDSWLLDRREGREPKFCNSNPISANCLLFSFR